MFRGCEKLVNVPKVLPAITLAVGCYSCMFRDCTKLKTAPELPATTLEDYCYSNMFQGCTELNYIKMLATDISASDCLYAWVSGVAPSGTFYKNITLQLDNNVIPNGWIVYDVDYVSPSFINTLNFDVDFLNNKDIYTPNSSNDNLLDKYTHEQILSMQPKYDLYIDIVYKYKDDFTGEKIKENYLWNHRENLNDILKGLDINNLDINSLDINKIVIIIVDIK